CTRRDLTSSQTRLPTRQNEGANNVDNVPLVAISTGQVDGLECVFKKLGLSTANGSNQFGNPPGTSSADQGRIRFYQDNDGPGATFDANTPKTNDALTDTQAHLNQYDAVIFGCAGAQYNKSTSALDKIRTY